MARMLTKDVWKSAITVCMEQFVMTSGMKWMLELSVGNWDTTTQVVKCENICVGRMLPKCIDHFMYIIYFHLIDIYTCTCVSDVAAVKRAAFGRAVSRPIVLDNVMCSASDVDISQCNNASVINCDHSEDAGVICGSKLIHIHNIHAHNDAV